MPPQPIIHTRTIAFGSLHQEWRRWIFIVHVIIQSTHRLTSLRSARHPPGHTPPMMECPINKLHHRRCGGGGVQDATSSSHHRRQHTATTSSSSTPPPMMNSTRRMLHVSILENHYYQTTQNREFHPSRGPPHTPLLLALEDRPPIEGGT